MRSEKKKHDGLEGIDVPMVVSDDKLEGELDHMNHSISNYLSSSIKNLHGSRVKSIKNPHRKPSLHGPMRSLSKTNQQFKSEDKKLETNKTLKSLEKNKKRTKVSKQCQILSEKKELELECMKKTETGVPAQDTVEYLKTLRCPAEAYCNFSNGGHDLDIVASREPYKNDEQKVQKEETKCMMEKRQKEQRNLLKAKSKDTQAEEFKDQRSMLEKLELKKGEKQEMNNQSEKADNEKEKEKVYGGADVIEETGLDHLEREKAIAEIEEVNFLSLDIENRMIIERQRDKERQRKQMTEISKLLEKQKQDEDDQEKEVLVVNIDQNSEMNENSGNNRNIEKTTIGQEEEDNKSKEERSEKQDDEQTTLKMMIGSQTRDQPEKVDLPEKLSRIEISEIGSYEEVDDACENSCSFNSSVITDSLHSYDSTILWKSSFELGSPTTPCTVYQHRSMEDLEFYSCSPIKEIMLDPVLGTKNDMLNLKMIMKMKLDKETGRDTERTSSSQVEVELDGCLTDPSEEKYQGEEKITVELEKTKNDVEIRDPETDDVPVDKDQHKSQIAVEFEENVDQMKEEFKYLLKVDNGKEMKRQIEGSKVARRNPENDRMRAKLNAMATELKKREEEITVADERLRKELRKLTKICCHLHKALSPVCMCPFLWPTVGRKKGKMSGGPNNGYRRRFSGGIVPKTEQPECVKPTVPKPTGSDIYEPPVGGSTGRLQILLVKKFGRRCSSHGDGSGGNYSQGQGHSGGDHSEAGGGRENEDSNTNNGNGYDGSSNHDGNRDRQGGGDEISPRRAVDTNVPEPDYKGFRKKHSQMSDLEWAEFLGLLIYKTKENNGPIWDIQNRHVSFCLSTCLARPDELTDEMLSCNVCMTINSLFKHYADCQAVYNCCSMCVQIFSLICSHVYDCISSNNNNNVAQELKCNIQLCVSITEHVSGRDIALLVKTLWFRVRNKLARIIGNVDDFVPSDPPPEVTQAPTKRPSRVSGVFHSLQSIPEDLPLVVAPGSRGNSSVLARKISNLQDVYESSLADESSSISGELQPEPQAHPESDAVPSLLESDPQSGGSASSLGQYIIQFAREQHSSMPMGPPAHHGDTYFPSFSDTPIGVKGIGEVVYADKKQLVKVARIWDGLKTQYQIESTLAKHYREEGVILMEFRNLLKIQGFRYNNEFQWVKVTHLGNGMSGKCHLATDFETEFKFCVKEIHISNYEKEEVELWSELDHPYIVQIYGAIRHGEKLYIFMEFVQGGCLTEVINLQKALGRRLSQSAALRYFQQLLQVLSYLQSKNILHEDLKADNILLKKGKGPVSIKVADFGLSRRCQGTVPKGAKPVGTQTQWSPEKAEGVGYGFPAEVWGAVCVMVHMLSGNPPWLRRYETFKALIVVIVEKSPPIEDIPRNIQEPVHDLIERGFTVCPGQRPSAEKLLLHRAFQLIQDDTLVSGVFSMLPSYRCTSTNHIEDEPNADLREIMKHLTLPDLPACAPGQQTMSYTVYTALHGATGNNGATGTGGTTSNGGPQTQAGDQTEDNTHKQLKVSEAGACAVPPMKASENTDPNNHYRNFIIDDPEIFIPQPPRQDLLVYSPDDDDVTAGERKLSNGSNSRIEEQVLKNALPDFSKLVPNGFSDDDEEVEDEIEDLFKNFDLDKAIKNMTLDPVKPNAHPPHIPNTVNSGESQIGSGGDIGHSQMPSPVFGNPLGDEEDNEDYLFRSGSPKKEIDHSHNAVIVSEASTVHVPTPANAYPAGVYSNLLQTSHIPRTDISMHTQPHPSMSNSPYSGGQFGFNHSNQWTGSNEFLKTTKPNTAVGQQQSRQSEPVGPPVGPSAESIYSRKQPQQSHDFVLPPLQQMPSTIASHLYGNNSVRGQNQSSNQQGLTGPPRYPTNLAIQDHSHSPYRLKPTPRFTSPKAYLSQESAPDVKKQRLSRQSNTPPSTTPDRTPFPWQQNEATVRPPRQNEKEKIDATNEMLKKFANKPTGSPKKPGLLIDINKAHGPATLPITQAQTAPVVSPPKTPIAYKSQTSVNTPRRIPSLSTPSPMKDKSSTSTPIRSVFEEQEEALEELKYTAEDAISQHSDSSHRLDLFVNHDPECEIVGEMEYDIENPAESLAHYLDSPEDEESITVIFKSDTNGRELKMKFPSKSKDVTWYEIINDELSRYPDMNSDFGLDQFSLRFEGGQLVDLDSALGDVNLVVMVGRASDSWWVEGGRLMHI